MSTSTMNYFGLLGIEVAFSVNRQSLDSAYRKLQQASHPDRFINQPSEFQRQAVQQAAQNIEAYQSLKSPVKRACHILSLAGSSFDLSSYTVSDINLLMEQMQYREQLSDIKEQGSFEQLTDFSDNLEKITTETENKIADIFKTEINNDSAELKNHICELQFLSKLAIDLDEVEEHLLLAQ